MIENLAQQEERPAPSPLQLALWLTTTGFCVAFVDRPLALIVEGVSRPILRVAALVSALTHPVAVILALSVVAAFGFCVRLMHPRGGLLQRMHALFGPASFVFLCGLAATLLAATLKNLMGRARPGATEPLDHLVFQPFAFDDLFGAMPSAQSAMAGALAMSLAILMPRWKPALLLAGLTICAARVVVGEHWASDVVAGWSLGVTMALLIDWARFRFSRLACRRRPAQSSPSLIPFDNHRSLK